jgi:hypothetical protein
VGIPAELLGDQVLSLAPGVGAAGPEVVEDLDLPALDGASQSPDFGRAGRASQEIEGDELPAGGREGPLRIDRAELFFHRPRPADLVVGVAMAQRVLESVPLVIAQTFVAPGKGLSEILCNGVINQVRHLRVGAGKDHAWTTRHLRR